MTVGLSSTVANAVLDALCRSAAWTEPAAVYIQLHTGDPGAAGTANVATETDRQQATFGDAASAGAISNTVALTWTAVAGTEDYTHFSAWDASTSGNFLFSGTMTANAVTTGDTFQIPIGDLDVTQGPVAA
jgi:uncharacterized membrane protein YgdD (TMEM256/DUF423 family)